MPKWELVTERLRHEEQKQKEKVPAGESGIGGRKAFTARQRKAGDQRKQFTCHFCKRPGHFKRDCRKFLAMQQAKKPLASPAETQQGTSSERSKEALVTNHMLSATTNPKSNQWIVDSGATCHMSNDEQLFSELRMLKTAQQVTLGDGHILEATAEGTVDLETLLPDGNSRKWKLENVLLVPKLSYSLLSVAKASEAGKTTKFNKRGCEIVNQNKEIIAFATRVGNLYYLEHRRQAQGSLVVEGNKERLWHRRYGHTGEQKLQRRN